MEVLPSAVHQHIDAISLAQDGTLGLASSSLSGRTWDGSVWIFREPSTAPEVEYSCGRAATESGVTDLKWLDSKRIVVGSDNGAVDIWSQSGSLLGLENLASLKEHDNVVSSVSVDCEKSRIISASWDRSIKVWDLTSEQCIRTLKGHSDFVLGVDCSGTEKDLFLSASRDGSVVLWDTRKPRPAKRLADPTQYDSIPCCLDWSPLDSSIFATGFEDGSIHVYSIKDTTKIIFSYTPHGRAVNRVAFSPRSFLEMFFVYPSPEWLASVSDDTLVHVQNVLNNTTVGWDCAVITHMCGTRTSSDLAVETSKSQATSIISLDADGQPRLQMNGELGEDADQENMDVEQVNGMKPLTESKLINEGSTTPS
ncbi:predicted protein [Nematostella vectensis]|uniref:Uncharacterized protein n=1 Tax=Nematostella vectensis TaxID=45351 RepID=A7SW82_NEMVE|nr:predicted protein [Nematostella vectensis]|eukprot:XP_001624135.1 predicted protein [Nematostella vectensis]